MPHKIQGMAWHETTNPSCKCMHVNFAVIRQGKYSHSAIVFHSFEQGDFYTTICDIPIARKEETKRLGTIYAYLGISSSVSKWAKIWYELSSQFLMSYGTILVGHLQEKDWVRNIYESAVQLHVKETSFLHFFLSFLKLHHLHASLSDLFICLLTLIL